MPIFAADKCYVKVRRLDETHPPIYGFMGLRTVVRVDLGRFGTAGTVGVGKNGIVLGPSMSDFGIDTLIRLATTVGVEWSCRGRDPMSPSKDTLAFWRKYVFRPYLASFSATPLRDFKSLLKRYVDIITRRMSHFATSPDILAPLCAGVAKNGSKNGPKRSETPNRRGGRRLS